MRQKDADGMVNSVSPDQAAHSGSTLFEQICPSEYLGPIRKAFKSGYLIFSDCIWFQNSTI